MTQFIHKPVLLQSVIRELAIQKDALYIDATLGGGGHTEEILKSGGKVLGIDQDQDAVKYVESKLSSYIQSNKLIVAQGNFKDICDIAERNGFGVVSGILFDLGVSSYQLDASGRGFSIRFDEKLDMRMDKTASVSAYEIVNKYSEKDLKDIFVEYGEEDRAADVAALIVESRKVKPIETTKELVTLIEKLIRRTGKLHPATKIFQAIRIETNKELSVLRLGLTDSIGLVGAGGRIAVISFHSLEDRMVKKLFDSWEEAQIGVVVTNKPITAHTDETASNPRAFSAKLRIFKKM